MASAKKDSRPKFSATVVTQLGLTAQDLATKYATQVGPRLDPNLLAALAADLLTIGSVVPAAKTARAGSKQATTAQGQALAVLYNHVTAIRTAVSRKKPTKDVSQAYSVGAKLNKLVVKDVTSAATMIVNRGTAMPAEAATFGIIPADITLMQTQIAAVNTADQAQEKARAAAPLSTKARNIVMNRIRDAVDSIAAAGLIAFANSPTERASFQALITKGS